MTAFTPLRLDYEGSTPKGIAEYQTGDTQQLGQVIGGTAPTVTSPGTAQTVSLDGRVHQIDLADGIETTITGTPLGSEQSAAVVRLKGSPAGTGTIAWASGHILMTAQTLNTAAGEWTDFLLSSHDGATVFIHGAGVQQ